MPFPAGYNPHRNGFLYRATDGAGPFIFDGTTPTLAASGAASGTINEFAQQKNGWWFKLADNSGPYAFDGTNFILRT